MPDPTPAAAATPAVLPLSAERQKHVLHVCASRGDVDYCDGCFDEWPCQVALLGMLDAAVAQRDAAVIDRDCARRDAIMWREATERARADLAEFARQTREAQASLLAAILDKEDERKRADAAVVLRNQWCEKAQDYENRLEHAEAALQAERNRRRWAETRASHWRREWYLTMDTLGVRSNELGRAHMAHRTALAQERQAREQAEAQRDEIAGFFGALEALLAQERARGERLADHVRALRDHAKNADGIAPKLALIKVFHTAENALEDWAAPASPAAEPADQIAVTAARGE